MHASKQTDRYSVAIRVEGGDDDDEHSRRQSSVQVRGVFSQRALRASCNRTSRTDMFSRCVSTLTAGFRCLAVWLHIICPLPSSGWWESTEGGERGGGSRKGDDGEGGREAAEEFALLCGVALRGNMKSAVHPHLVHHGIQEGALTPALECDVWNVCSMEC